MPSIIGGLDIHRKQVTFDYLDTVTGEVRCGQVAPADRAHLRAWLARFENPAGVAFAAEACTGWRYVTEELQRAGMEAHLAEPADTAAARGPKRRAKTDRADARLQRELLMQGRLPECWIPPSHILECRALLELYHDLRTEHTAWVQRIHAVLFHQGAPAFHDLSRADAPAQLAELARGHLSPAGQVQIGIYLRILAGLEAELAAVRHRLLAAARRLHGAKVLAESIYGVGPPAPGASARWPPNCRPCPWPKWPGPKAGPRSPPAPPRRPAPAPSAARTRTTPNHPKRREISPLNPGTALRRTSVTAGHYSSVVSPLPKSQVRMILTSSLTRQRRHLAAFWPHQSSRQPH